MIKIRKNSEIVHQKNEPLKVNELFSVPIYEKKFANHSSFKQSIINHLLDDNLYIKNTSRDTLKFSHPNLHKEPEYQPFVEFLKEAASEVFIDMGFVPNFELTGLWATKQNLPGSYHHRHIHHNSFLSGVYYLEGDPNKKSGTTFFSDWKDPLIKPACISEDKQKIKYNCTFIFEEGKAIIFPAWVEHSTPINNDNSERIILSFNFMPIGKTNSDPLERYNYQSIENAELINYNEEKYK